MAKIVYLMRHGQTLFNELKKVQGWCDSPLTELGKEQARQVRQYFQSPRYPVWSGLCIDSRAGL